MERNSRAYLVQPVSLYGDLLSHVSAQGLVGDLGGGEHVVSRRSATAGLTNGFIQQET